LRAGSTDSAGLMESCPLEAIAGSGDCQALARSGGYEDGLCRDALHSQVWYRRRWYLRGQCKLKSH
jgi:hypothetical protein